jgi:protein-export membrane protein SecD
MLHFPRWKVLAILAVVLAGVIFAAPNFLPKPWQDTLRHYSGLTPMVHGLDLQGGSSFLVELDSKEMLDTWIVRQVADIRVALREAHIGYTALGRTSDGVSVEIIDAVNVNKANELLNRLGQPLDSATGPIFELSRSGQKFTLAFSKKAVEARIGKAVEQAIEILKNRLNGLGITEASIQRHGRDRILIQVPGTNPTEQLRKMLGQAGMLTFQAACENQPVQPADLPPEDCVAFAMKDIPHQMLWVTATSSETLDGHEIDEASASVDAVTNEPVVNFSFNQKGTERFARVTSDNVGKFLAIILDGQVISAPRIMEPILGGSGQISGRFTIEDANSLVIVLRSGALPARLVYIDAAAKPTQEAQATRLGP